MKVTDYENYSKTSKKYDETRVPIGFEVILGCFSGNSLPLSEQVVLDAGCGTGNYSREIHSKVKQLYCLDLNSGMLEQAKSKLENATNVVLKQGSLTEMPFGDAVFDGITCNQVLHHLDDENNNQKFPNLKNMLRESYRVLKPGGRLIINTTSHEQYHNGIWFSQLIPQAVEKVLKRFCHPKLMSEFLEETGFEIKEKLALLDGVMQGENYLDPEGPLKQEWRDGDSTWSLVDDTELEKAISRVKEMNKTGEIHNFLNNCELQRQKTGQTMFIYAVKN